jgi:hypothetical protein
MPPLRRLIRSSPRLSKRRTPSYRECRVIVGDRLGPCVPRKHDRNRKYGCGSQDGHPVLLSRTDPPPEQQPSQPVRPTSCKEHAQARRGSTLEVASHVRLARWDGLLISIVLAPVGSDTRKRHHTHPEIRTKVWQSDPDAHPHFLTAYRATTHGSADMARLAGVALVLLALLSCGPPTPPPEGGLPGEVAVNAAGRNPASV